VGDKLEIMETEDTVVVFIIGGAGYETSEPEFTKSGEGKRTRESFVPGVDLDELVSVVDSLQEFYNLPVEVHMVDALFKIRYYSTPEGQAYFNKLHNLREEMSPVVRFHDCHWYEFRKTLTMNENSHYYFGTHRSYDSPYTAFNVLELTLQDNVYLKTGIQSIADVVDAECYYNVFRNRDDSYASSRGTIPREDPEEIRAFLAGAVVVMNSFREAGFFNQGPYVQSRIRTHVLQTEGVFVKGLILEYEIYPQERIIVSEKLSTGKTIQEKFTESASYRSLLCEYGAKVLCKLGMRYGLLKFVSDPMTVDFNQLLGTPVIPEVDFSTEE
jgi:hypothetical protein